MDWGQILVTAITVIISSGIIQFFVNRRDKKVEDSKKNHEEELKKEMKDHLTNVNDKWKVDYCDKNAKAIEDLVKEVRTGLTEREDTGRKRYEEHKLAIENMNIEHQKDFLALKEAIAKLTENDSKITESLTKIADKQNNMAESLVGQAHDRIIFLTDKITDRGAITNKEKATIKSMYLPYSSLGGNGEVRESVEYVLELPTIKESEAKERDVKIKQQQMNM